MSMSTSSSRLSGCTPLQAANAGKKAGGAVRNALKDVGEAAREIFKDGVGEFKVGCCSLSWLEIWLIPLPLQSTKDHAVSNRGT